MGRRNDEIRDTGPRNRVPKSRAFLAPVVIVIAALTLACVGNELRSMESARAEHEECVADHGAEHADCRLLNRRLLDAQKHYEAASRNAWACDPLSEQCPITRR